MSWSHKVEIGLIKLFLVLKFALSWVVVNKSLSRPALLFEPRVKIVSLFAEPSGHTTYDFKCNLFHQLYMLIELFEYPLILFALNPRYLLVQLTTLSLPW